MRSQLGSAPFSLAVLIRYHGLDWNSWTNYKGFVNIM